MQEPAVPQNLHQVGTRSNSNVDPVDLFLGDGGTLGRSDHFILPPVLDGGTVHLAPEINGHNVEDVAHLVPVHPAVAGNGEGAAPGNLRLQHTEQQDLQAVCNVLGIHAIPDNVITPRHFWRVLKELGKILPREGPFRIPHGQAHHLSDYARILERLARVITVPSKEDYEAAHRNRDLHYEALFQLLQDDSCPSEYGECMDRLCDEMSAVFSMMQGADGVYVVKNRDEYASCLCSLAARLRRAL